MGVFYDDFGDELFDPLTPALSRRERGIKHGDLYLYRIHSGKLYL